MEKNKGFRFYKCKSNEYQFFHKGKIYCKDSIGIYLIENPKDWSGVLDYPTTNEIIDCIENGKNKVRLLKKLKRWKS